MPKTISTTHLSLFVTQDSASMAEVAAALIIEEAKKAIAERGVFTLAISGGKTPIPLFNLLATPEYQNAIDWRKTVVFWVDERCVGPDHEESNYGVARKALLSRADITSYHRIRGEEGPEKASRLYEQQLEDYFKLPIGEMPRFDCIHLGVGSDGHTGSLFWEDPGLQVKDRICIPVAPNSYTKRSRVTLTLPVLNNARCCIVMADGREKHHVLTTALNLMAAPQLPAQHVRPHDGRVCWVVDEVAFNG